MTSTRVGFSARIALATVVALAAAGCGGGGSSPNGSGGVEAVSPVAPSSKPTASPAPGSTSTPPSGGSTPAPGTSATPAASIVAAPSAINVATGSGLEIGVLDPGKFPLTVSSTGGLTPAVLGTVSNLVNGLLQPNAGGVASLALNDVGGEDLATLVGGNGSTLRICAQGSSTNCASVSLTANPAGLAISSSLASIALQPGQSMPLTVTALTSQGGIGPFTALSSSPGITVSPTGLGAFTIAAAANVGVPTSATITVTDALGHTISIPVSVL